MIWDVAMLSDFLAFYERKQPVAIMGLVFLGGSLVSGLVFGWYLGRSSDDDLRRFHEQVRKEIERRKTHA